MAIDIEAIRTAVVEVLHGLIDDTREVRTDVFGYGVHEGMTEQAKQAKTLVRGSGRNRFDVVFSGFTTHPASSVSSTGSRRLVNMPITIQVMTRLPSEIQLCDRDQVRADVMSDCEDAIQALSHPGALTRTKGGLATGIVGGLMRSTENRGVPDWRLTNENWDGRRLESEIVGNVIVDVTANEVAA